MKNIIQFALSTKFGNDIEPIMEVIAATGNAGVAAEIILGIYTEPEIPGVNKVFDNHKDDKVNIKFEHYDRFKEQVSYSYQRVKSKHAWFKKGDEPVKENIVSERYWSEDAAKELELDQDDFNKDFHRVAYHTEIESQTNHSNKYLSDWCDYISRCTEVIAAEPDLATIADQEYEAQLSM